MHPKKHGGLRVRCNGAARRGYTLTAGLAVALAYLAGLGPGLAQAQESCPNGGVLVEDAGFLGFQPEAAAPPGCRGYEMVSPPYKEGFPIGGLQGSLSAVSADGDRVIANSLGAFAGTEGQSARESYLYWHEFTREGTGWVSSVISPSSARFPVQGLAAASNDLSRTLWSVREPSESIYAADLYVREADGAFAEVGPMVPPSLPGPPGGYHQVGFSGAEVVGASRDLSRVVLSLPAPIPGHQSLLWPGDETKRVGEGAFSSSLYEYAGTGGSRPELVGVDGAGMQISACDTWLGGASFFGGRYNAVSANGETVFFTAEREEVRGTEACRGPVVNELYARVAGSDTVALSEPTAAQCSTCVTATPQDAEFQGASEDGSKAFFTTGQNLLSGTSGTLRV